MRIQHIFDFLPCIQESLRVSAQQQAKRQNKKLAVIKITLKKECHQSSSIDTPFTYYNVFLIYPFPQNKIRHEINEWIRTTDEIDGFIDLDKAMRNPNDIDAMLPIYDSGDHLHPSEEGAKRMAEEFLKFLK